MLKFLAKIYTVLFLLGVSIFVILNFEDFILYTKKPYLEYRKIYKAALKSTPTGSKPKVDLSSISSVDWDEAVLWTSYENLCELGINGYEKGNKDCPSQNDTTHVFLLKDKNIVAKIPIGYLAYPYQQEDSETKKGGIIYTNPKR